MEGYNAGLFDCRKNRNVRKIWFTLLILCFLVLFFIIFFIGYKCNVGDWNENAVETSCNVTRVYTMPAATAGDYAKYTFSCNGTSTCSGYYQNGWIDVIYENHTRDVLIYKFESHHETDPNKIIQEISKTYLVGSLHQCYYQQENIDDFRLFWDYGIGYLISAGLMCLAIMAVTIAWATLQILDPLPPIEVPITVALSA